MKRKLVILILVLAGCLLLVALWQDNSSKRTLPDGTTFVLSDVKIGQTNVYTHGTLLSKLIGRLAPRKGLSVGRFHLSPPIDVKYAGIDSTEILTAQIWLRPGSPRETEFKTPQFFRKFRLLLSGDSDYFFVKEFDGFKRQPDGLFAMVWADDFPRDSRRLRFRLEERDTPNDRAWREVTTFIVKNPKPARVESWIPKLRPHFQLSGDLEVEVGDLLVKREPVHPTDIWEYLALLPIRVTRNGQAITNWGIRGGRLQDAAGNIDSFTFGPIITNDWMVYQIFRPLDPAKVWNFRIHFALDSNFPATNLFSFTLPWPLRTIIQTNLGGFSARIRSVNGIMLSVELVDQPTQTRLTFVSALDGQGNSLNDHTGSWDQHHFWRSLKSPKSKQIHVTVALHPDYQAEFTLMPQYEPAAERPDAKSAPPTQSAR